MPTPPLIRRATSADVPVLTELLGELGYPAGPDRVATTLAMLLEDPRTFVLVAAGEDGAVSGFLAISSRPVLRLHGTVGTIEELVVRPMRRGQGIGSRLVQYAKGLATEYGWVRLEAAPTRARESHRRGFLATHGFAPVDTVGYRWGLLESRHPALPTFRTARRREFV